MRPSAIRRSAIWVTALHVGRTKGDVNYEPSVTRELRDTRTYAAARMLKALRLLPEDTSEIERRAARRGAPST